MRTFFTRKKAHLLVIGVAMITASASFSQSRTETASAPQADTALPDVVGIRPGISAQEAYDLLKARGPRAKIGVGQFPVAGVTDKPVPVSMSLDIPDADPAETITVWLTMPPSKQVVWAVGRRIVYEQNKQLLKSIVTAGLVKKYGPEVDEQSQYWAFDEQGRRSDDAGQKGANCKNRAKWTLAVTPPEAATYASFTPLLFAPAPLTLCDSLVEVRTVLDGPGSPEYVSGVTVILSDLALARRFQEACQAVLANANGAKQKEELDKAKQQKGPTF
jgi:hypothetical protein